LRVTRFQQSRFFCNMLLCKKDTDTASLTLKELIFFFYFRLFALKTIELDEGKKTRTKEAVQKEARLIFECLSPLISKTYFENIELFNLKITNYYILL